MRAMNSAAARLLARQGAEVRVASRSLERAQQTCHAIAARVPGAKLTPLQTASAPETMAALAGAQIAIAAGAAGVELIPADVWRYCVSLQVAIDLNAVPPLGIAGVEVMDKAKEQGGVICYGAIGVGGTKMKLHKAAIRRLFESNDAVLDAEEIYALGEKI